MLQRLDFTIGGTICSLVNVQPNNGKENRRGKYYEHYHSYFELHYVEEGEVLYTCGKKNVTVFEGELLIIPPRMYHEELSSRDGTQKAAISLDISEPSKKESTDVFL